MSRINFPIDFHKQSELLTAIDAKNTAEGANSPLKAYLEQNDIDLAELMLTLTAAKNRDVSRALLVKQANNYRQQRDKHFDPVFSNVRGETQFLKSLYGANYAGIGNWGINIDKNGRVTYPAGFSSRKDLFGAFYSKYGSYPAGESPLQVYLNQQHISMAADAAAVQEAAACDASFNAATRQAENETQMRDILWQPILKIMRGIGDFLKKLYGDNDRQLGLWGFTVDNSIPKPKVRTTKLKLGEEKTINSIVLGTTLNNIGMVDIVVYKGKIKNGTSVLVKSGEKMGIEKGWSNAIVANTSKLETAVYQVTVSR